MAFSIKQLFKRPAKPATMPPQWPSPEANTRFQEYKKNKSIWSGDHEAIFSQYVPSTYPLWITANIAKNIVTVPADFLFGEELELTFDDDVDEEAKKKVQEIWDRNKMHMLMYESALDTNTYGDGVFIPERDDEGLCRIRSRPVSTWVPTLDPDDNRVEIRHEFGWTKANNGKVFLRVVRHEEGFVHNELFLMQGQEVKRPATDSEWRAIYGDDVPAPEIKTGVDELLVVHVPNFRGAEDYHGKSEFWGVESLFAGIDARLTQSNRILTRHADPILGLPVDLFRSEKGIQPGTRPYNPLSGSGIDKERLSVVQAGPNGEMPQYITWDGHIEDNLKLIDGYMQMLSIVTETAPQLLNRGEFGGDLSGRALKILLVRTLAKVNRKRIYYTDAIKRVIDLAQQIEGMEPIEVGVKWADGLPQDMLEAIEIAERKLNAQIESQKGAIMEVDDVDEEAADKKIKEIEGEQEKEDERAKDMIVAKGGVGTSGRSPINVNVGKE